MNASFSIEILSGSAKALPSAEGMTNVLVEIGYRLIGSDGKYFAYRKGMASFPLPSPSSFVEFSQITPALLEQWLEDTQSDAFVALKAEMEQELIATAQSAAAISIELPWETKISGPSDQRP